MMLRRFSQVCLAVFLVISMSFLVSTPALAADCDGWASPGTTHRNNGNGCYYTCQSNGSWSSPQRCDGQGDGQCQGCGQASKEDAARAVTQRQKEAEKKIEEQGGLNSAATKAVQQETAQKYGTSTATTPRDDDPLTDAAGQIGESCDPNSGSAGSVGAGGKCCIGGVVECGDTSNGSCGGGIGRFGTYGVCGTKLSCGDGLASAHECSAPNVCPRDYQRCEEQGFTVGTGEDQPSSDTQDSGQTSEEIVRYDKLVQECLFSELQLEEGTLDTQCVQRLTQATDVARRSGALTDEEVADRRQTLGAYYTATYNAARAEALCAQEATASCADVLAETQAAVTQTRQQVGQTFGVEVTAEADKSARSYREHIANNTRERVQAAADTDKTMAAIEEKCSSAAYETAAARERCLRVEMRVKLGLDLDEDGDVVIARDSSYNQQFCGSTAVQNTQHCGTNRVTEANQVLGNSEIQIELDQGSCGFQGGCECRHYGGTVPRGGRCYPDNELWVDSRANAALHTGCGGEGQSPCNGRVCDNPNHTIQNGVCSDSDVEDTMDLPDCPTNRETTRNCLCRSTNTSLTTGQRCAPETSDDSLSESDALEACPIGVEVSEACLCDSLSSSIISGVCPGDGSEIIEVRDVSVCAAGLVIEACLCDGEYMTRGEICRSGTINFGDIRGGVSATDSDQSSVLCEGETEDCIVLREGESSESVVGERTFDCADGLELVPLYEDGIFRNYTCVRTTSLEPIANDVPCQTAQGCRCQSSGVVVSNGLRCPVASGSVHNECAQGRDVFQVNRSNSVRCSLEGGEAFQCASGYILQGEACVHENVLDRWAERVCQINNRLPGCPGYVQQVSPGEVCGQEDLKQCQCVGGEFVGQYCAAPQVVGIGERCRFPDNPALCECPRGQLVNGACYPPQQNRGCFMQAGSVECREGFEYRCEGSWYNGSWQFTGQTCNNDACIPGTLICDGTTGVKLCKSDGSGWIQRNCASGSVCAGGRCSAQCEQTNQILGENRIVTTGPANQCVLLDGDSGTAQRAQECGVGTHGCTYGNDSSRWACVPDAISCSDWWNDCNNSDSCEEDNQQVYLCGAAGNEEYCQVCGGPGQIACECENDYNWSCTLNRPEGVPSLRGDVAPEQALDSDYQCVQSPLTSDVSYVCQECGGAGQPACVSSDGENDFMVLEAVPGAAYTDVIDQGVDIVEYSQQSTVYRCDNIASVMSPTPNRVCAPYCGGATGVTCPAQPASNHSGVFTRDVSRVTGENVDPSIRYELLEEPIPGFSFGY